MLSEVGFRRTPSGDIIRLSGLAAALQPISAQQRVSLFDNAHAVQQCGPKSSLYGSHLTYMTQSVLMLYLSLQKSVHGQE
jgi:hypothetical protein